TAIFPNTICSVKFLDPTATWAPSTDFPSTGPASSPLWVKPPDVPNPHAVSEPIKNTDNTEATIVYAALRTE
ncbi:MAG TPA: hypothetical protein K8V54_00620, partial [Corynebacterium kroppenstedtii]|nr:hypothetical protein [Corynebacterium kroppenstedtii]